MRALLCIEKGGLYIPPEFLVSHHLLRTARDCIIIVVDQKSKHIYNNRLLLFFEVSVQQYAFNNMELRYAFHVASVICAPVSSGFVAAALMHILQLFFHVQGKMDREKSFSDACF